jgi:diguanylate cyclase (GGDEF)-like protein
MNRFIYSFFGIVGGLTIPFSWLLWRAFSTRKAWWLTWFKSEFKQHDQVYILLAFFSVTLLVAVGYFIGWMKDEEEQESKSIKDSHESLSQLASSDGLTGLYNARYVHDRLDIEIENAYRSPLTCLLLDIDHFKKINDTYGHPFGDTVLVQVAQILKKSIRRVDDVVGRLGGEEFIVILPHTPQDRALTVAERIRDAVESEDFKFDNKRVTVTVSIGVVSYPFEGLSDKKTMLKAVDEALYVAKRSGRNRVMVYTA